MTGAGKRKLWQNGKVHGITASMTPKELKVTKLLACFDGHRLAREKAFGMLRVEVTSQCAFLRLGDTIAHRLAPLFCHQMRVFAGAGAQGFLRFSRQTSTVTKGRVPPTETRLLGF